MNKPQLLPHGDQSRNRHRARGTKALHESFENDKPDPETDLWIARHPVVSTIPVFLLLLALFSSISMATDEKWDLTPYDRTMEAVQHTTSVAFVPQKGSIDCPSQASAQIAQGGLCGMANTVGRYKIRERHTSLTVTRPSTGEKQKLDVLIREPIGYRGKAPGILFLHGIGTYDTQAFADIAVPYASAGYVTMVADKPVWSTLNINHDYPAEARADDACLKLLRAQPTVDSSRVGVYATSESGYVVPYLLHDDRHIAFQIYLSPMLFSPRKALAFFISEDVSIVGANAGYQGFIRRAVSTNLGLVGLHNFDIDPIDDSSFAIPTFLALGSKDVMTAHIDGAARVMKLAQQAGNTNFVIRDYPLANHVMRIGDEEEGNTRYADHMVDDVITWSNGIVRGQRQTAEHVAGSDLYQALSLPSNAHEKTGQTIYMIVLHVALVLSLLASLIFSIIMLGRWIGRRLRHQPKERLFHNGFGRTLWIMSAVTIMAFLMFCDGLADVVLRVISLCYGAAPQEPGFISWSWYVIVLGCILVIWTWAGIFTRMLIVGVEQHRERLRTARHLRQRLIRHGVDPASISLRSLMRGIVRRQRQSSSWEERHLFTRSRLGMSYALVVSATMMLILLFFAFWGVFVF